MTMQLALLWTWNRALDRVPYLLTGVVLFIVKFGIDWTIATFGFGQPWSPLNYLVWPNDRIARVWDLTDPERWFSLTMLLVSLPFIWAGVILSLHRLRAVGLPLGLVLFFFVPIVNLLLFLVLALLPTQAALPVVALGPATGKRLQPLRRTHQRLTRDSHWRSGLVALGLTVPLAVLCVYWELQTLQSYGLSLFVGAPFGLGMFSVLIFGFSQRQSFGACLLVALVAASLAGGAMIVLALEGIVCLIMAAPIMFILAFLGALVGYAIQSRPWLTEYHATIALAMLVTLPGMMAAEAANEPEPIVRAVRTEVIIDAPPATVWEHVVAFPPLPEPNDWFFRTGIAYPVRAEIHGNGVGAMRHCVFSTGAFVEPIEVWDQPRLLRFRVTEQPEPMREWSPYHIHPAHLDHYLVSRKGQFLLEALPDGRTRLEGTTWYSNRMWPAPYWNLWSDYTISRIHRRVLTHIQTLAELR